jgi:hypothetical protein
MKKYSRLFKDVEVGVEKEKYNETMQYRSSEAEEISIYGLCTYPYVLCLCLQSFSFGGGEVSWLKEGEIRD